MQQVMNVEEIRPWNDASFRELDNSTRAMAIIVARMLAALAVAFIVGDRIVDAAGLGHGWLDTVLSTLIQLALSALALGLTIVRRMRRLTNEQHKAILATEKELEARIEEHALLRDVQESLEMGETEADALGATRAALAAAVEGPAEFLMADASRAHLRLAAAADGRPAPGCSVETPWGCPAVRRGQTMHFKDSGGLAACPRLRERGGSLSAVCVPVTILGTPTAVIHATSTTDSAWSRTAIERIEGVAAQVGARLGVLRAMTKSQLQAETDPLTGLLNRRALEEQVRGLSDRGVPFAVAMADLDHFKQLNDMHGHDTGDRALRMFARVMTEAVRDGDLVARFGGEEFVVILPNLDAHAAAPILQRVQRQLRGAVGSAEIPSFTVSIGIADSSVSSDLTEMLRSADRRLFVAKAGGRDQIIVDDAPTDSTPQASPIEVTDPVAIDPDECDAWELRDFVREVGN